MTAGRILRANAVALLLTLLFVPALTQPVRRLTAGPVNQSSSFSRIAELSTDHIVAPVFDAAPMEPADDLADSSLAPIAGPAEAAAAPPDPIPLVTFRPPSPLRAPPAAAGR